MGRGDSALRTLGLRPVPTGELAALVPQLRSLLAGEEVDGIRLRWASGERVPILMAATGPRNLRVAGGLADVVMLQVGTRPESVAWAVERVREGAEAAGRDPDDVEISLLCGMWVGGERAEAEGHTRWAAACAANHLSDVARHSPEHGMPEPLVRLVEARREHYDYYAGHLDSAADHAEFLSSEMIDDFAIQGSPERCLERIRELAALGVGEISSAYLNGCLEQLELVGRELVPALQTTPA
jgi:alkanesulfonate monooxygenase SsuD/methylene tetrahydromethanopterin reductase-like flavin-dependent oxidoreductase (luciferase family)